MTPIRGEVSLFDLGMQRRCAFRIRPASVALSTRLLWMPVFSGPERFWSRTSRLIPTSGQSEGSES